MEIKSLKNSFDSLGLPDPAAKWVLTGFESKPVLTEEEKAARRVEKAALRKAKAKEPQQKANTVNAALAARLG